MDTTEYETDRRTEFPMRNPETSDDSIDSISGRIIGPRNLVSIGVAVIVFVTMLGVVWAAGVWTGQLRTQLTNVSIDVKGIRDSTATLAAQFEQSNKRLDSVETEIKTVKEYGTPGMQARVKTLEESFIKFSHDLQVHRIRTETNYVIP